MRNFILLCIMMFAVLRLGAWYAAALTLTTIGLTAMILVGPMLLDQLQVLSRHYLSAWLLTDLWQLKKSLDSCIY